MEKLNVFYATSDLYAPITGVSITSLFINNRDIEAITVYIFADGVSEENQKKFAELGNQFGREIVIIDAKSMLCKFEKLNMGGWRGSSVAYGKAFCMDVVPDDIDRLVVLDGDTIVVGSLRPAMQCDLAKNQVMAMVKDFHPDGERDKPALYNSGFIIYDVKKWREEKWSDKLYWHIENVQSNFRIVDQELLNAVCEGHILKLPPMFNFLPIHRAIPDDVFFTYHIKDLYSREEIKYAHNHPIVIHMYRFLGTNPWEESSPHPDRELFDEYLSKSLWKDYVKKPLTNDIQFRIERMLYKKLSKKAFFKLFVEVQIVETKRQEKKHLRQINKQSK